MGFCPSGLLSQWAFVRSPRRPTGFTNVTFYVALDVDVLCPDVVAVSVCVWVLLFGGGGGGGVCVSRDVFELQ